MRRDPEVNVIRNRAFAAIFAASAAAALGCGSPAHAGRHVEEKATPAPAPPTPDTTPIEVLRTPAGLVLKLDAPVPTPAASPTAAK